MSSPIKYNSRSLAMAVLASTLFASMPALAVTQIVNGADAVADGNDVDFQTDHKLTVNDGTNIAALVGVSVTATGGASIGTMQFDGTSTVDGSITAAGNILKLIDINAQAAGKTVTITGVAKADDINISTANSKLILSEDTTVTNDIDFVADGMVQLATGKTITGAVDATGGVAGTLEFLGVGAVTGAVGATNGLKLVTVNAGAVTTSENLKATTFNFAGDGTLSVADTKTITGNVTTTTNNTGTLTFAGGSTATGDIGASAKMLKVINLTGANTLGTTGDIHATTFNFLGDGVLNVAAGKQLNALVDAAGANTGTINFAGSSTTTQKLGSTQTLKAVNVNAGTLSLGANIKATDTTVANGATLSPTANNLTISNDLNLNGTLNVGTNTLNVGGVYNQNNGSTLNVTITGGAAPVTGNIVGTANAVVNATSTVNISLAGGAIPDGSTVQILASGAGAGVNVPTTVVGNSVAYTFSLVTDNGALAGKDLFIQVDRDSYPETTNVSTTAIAKVLETVAINPAIAPHLQTITNALDLSPNAQDMSDKLNTLIPLSNGELIATTQISVAKGDNTAFERLSHLRHQNRTYTAGDGQQDRGAWAQVFGSDISQDLREMVPGYDATNFGIAFGGDVEVQNNITLGAAASFSHTDVNSRTITRSGIEVNTYQGILYASFDDNSPCYVDAVLSVARNDYDSTRIMFMTPTSIAYGDFAGWQFNATAEAGYEIVSDGFIITPNVSFRYTHLNIDNYTETGTGPGLLFVTFDSMSEAVLGAGITIATEQRSGDTIFTPEFRAGVFYDFDDDAQVTTANFLGAGGAFPVAGLPAFAVPGPKPDQTLFQVGTGIEIRNKNHIFDAHYNYEFKDGFKVHSGYLKYRCEFA